MTTHPMIGMVLVTHGRLADEFVAAMEHVVGAQPQVATVCIGPEDDMEQRRAEILDPRDTNGLRMLAITLRDVRDWPEAQRTGERVRAIHIHAT